MPSIFGRKDLFRKIEKVAEYKEKAVVFFFYCLEKHFVVQ